MGAMRPSINACQKIVKTKYYPNCLNLRSCLSCLPARASSLSVGKNITNISRFPFFEIPSRPSQFQCLFFSASRRCAVGVLQAARLGVWYQERPTSDTSSGGLRYGRCIIRSVARYIPLRCVHNIEVNHDIWNTTNEQLWYPSSLKYLKCLRHQNGSQTFPLSSSNLWQRFAFAGIIYTQRIN